jgi:hypothetical protein
MRLHMVKPLPFSAEKSVKRSDLVKGQLISLIRSNRKLSSAEALKIRQAGVSAYLNLLLQTKPDGVSHHRRISGVEAAGNVGRGYIRQELRIPADCISAVSFSQVTVHIDSPFGRISIHA